jgi:hypothetical protein
MASIISAGISSMAATSLFRWRRLSWSDMFVVSLVLVASQGSDL